MAADYTPAELEEIKRKRWQDILSADRQREIERRHPSKWYDGLHVSVLGIGILISLLATIGFGLAFLSSLF